MNSPFTPAYIAMVRASEEIQAMRPNSNFESGDWFITNTALYGKDYGDILRSKKTEIYWRQMFSENEIQCVGDVLSGGEVPEPEWSWVLGSRDSVTWIPRLDQLLKIIGDFISWLGIIPNDFDSALRSIKADPGRAVDWCEIALAVVMRKKYGKVWSGEKWEML